MSCRWSASQPHPLGLCPGPREPPCARLPTVRRPRHLSVRPFLQPSQRAQHPLSLPATSVEGGLWCPIRPSVWLPALPPRHLSHVSHQSHACCIPSMWSLCGPGLGAGPGSIWVDGWGLELEQAPGHGDHQVGNGGGDQRRRLPPQAEQGPCRRCAGGTRGLRGGSGAPRQRPRKGSSPRRRLVPQLPSPSHSQSRPSAPGPSTACPPAWGSLSLPQMGVVSQTKGPDPDCRSPAREHPQVSRGPPSPQPGGLPAVQGGQASSPQEAPSSRAAPPHRVLSPKAEAGFAAPTPAHGERGRHRTQTGIGPEPSESRAEPAACPKRGP